MTVSERLRSCWGPTWLARRSPVKQASEITSTALRVNSELALTSFPMCWVVKATSVTATEFCGSVISSNLPVPVNSSLVHSWNSPWAVCLLFIMWKNVRVFVSHNSAGFHGTFHLHNLYYNIASRAAQSNSVYVSVLKILIVHANSVSKSLRQNFFFRASGHC